MYIYLLLSRPTKFERNDLGYDKKPIGILFYEDNFQYISELPLKCNDPYLVAYKCLNISNIPNPLFWISFDISMHKDEDLVSMDFDSFSLITGDRNLPLLKFKQWLKDNNIHSDFQRSPHGFHLIVHGYDIDIIKQNFKKTLKDKFALDAITTVVPMDGQIIGDFIFRTEKNWT